MKYFVNYDFHMITKAEKKPKAIQKNRRYDHSFSEWTEVNKETYEKMFTIYWEEAENF